LGSKTNWRFRLGKKKFLIKGRKKKNPKT